MRSECPADERQSSLSQATLIPLDDDLSPRIATHEKGELENLACGCMKYMQLFFNEQVQIRDNCRVGTTIVDLDDMWKSFQVSLEYEIDRCRDAIQGGSNNDFLRRPSINYSMDTCLDVCAGVTMQEIQSFLQKQQQIMDDFRNGTRMDSEAFRCDQDITWTCFKEGLKWMIRSCRALFEWDGRHG